MRRIIIARHGNTFAHGQQPRRIGSRSDPALTSEGQQQARALGRHFAQRCAGIDEVLTGPLLRARQTSEIIRRELRRTERVRISPWLNEIDHGPDEGKNDERIVARIGADALAAWDKSGVFPPGWVDDGEWRIAAWRCFFATNSGTTSLLVTSNGAARFALIAAHLSSAPPHLKLRTGAFGELDVDDKGAARLVNWDVRPSHDPSEG